MTTFAEVDVACALCGTPSRQHTLTSTSSFGPPDLDLRPNGPARWALEFCVQHCRACGYCAPSIGETPPEAAGAVALELYQSVLRRSRMPRLARQFFCAALVAEAAERRGAAAWHFAEAAWACDDADADEQARICRERAAEMLASALEWGDASAPRTVVHAVIADLLRRAGRFDDAIDACALAEAELDAAADEGHTARVVSFIRELAEAEDGDGHSAAEAFAIEE